MSKIETYVFLDLGTTGPIQPLDKGEISMPDITELSMLVVKRTALVLCEPIEEPRVLNKFQMFFNPSVTIHEKMVEDTGLKDALLIKETRFDKKVFIAINSFIECLEKPVCLIAHGGFLYHFPILQYHLVKMNVHFASDIKCADSLQVFFDLMLKEEYAPLLYSPVEAEMIETVETICKEKSYVKLLRNPYYAPDVKPHKSYHLVNIYKQRIKDDETGKKQKTAEGHCFMIMKIAQTLKGFENWVQKDHCLFSDIPIYPTFEETWCLDDDDNWPKETEVEESFPRQNEVENSSSERKTHNSSRRWYDVFNFF